jgi:hypothetical protein
MEFSFFSFSETALPNHICNVYNKVRCSWQNEPWHCNEVWLLGWPLSVYADVHITTVEQILFKAVPNIGNIQWKYLRSQPKLFAFSLLQFTQHYMFRPICCVCCNKEDTHNLVANGGIFIECCYITRNRMQNQKIKYCKQVSENMNVLATKIRALKWSCKKRNNLHRNCTNNFD